MFCMIYSFYLKRTILITFNGEENTCLLTRTLPGQEIMGMLKLFKYLQGYLVKRNSLILPGVGLACLGYFGFL